MTEILVILCIALAVDFLLRCARPAVRIVGPHRDCETEELREKIEAVDLNEAIRECSHSYGDILLDGSRITGVTLDQLGFNLWLVKYETTPMSNRERFKREWEELYQGPYDEPKILEYHRADFTPLFSTGCFLAEGCLTANEARKLNNLPPLADGESRGIHA